MAVHSNRWGGKIGPRVAMLVTQSMVYTHTKLATLKHRIAMSVFHAISDEISEELDVTLGPLIAQMHDSLSEDHPAYPIVHFLHTQKGQLKAIAGTGLQMSGLLGSIATVMNNELAPVVYTFVGANPHLIPQAGDVASMAAIGVVDEGLATSVIGSNGFDNGWAKAYLELARNYPTADVGIDLLRRGQISEENLTLLFQRAGIPVDYWGPMLALRNVPLSVADAALAVLRGNMSSDDGYAVAAENGFTLQQFDILVGNTGEPPGTEQLLEAYRRGFIGRDELERGIKQSRVRNEWIAVLEQLRYSPMSVADAVNAVVQNHMDMTAGERIAEFNGLEPGAFSILYETAGEPLSRTEMEDLYNRGLATEDEVKQALSESRLKNKYIPQAFDLHRKVIPVFTVQRALRYGGIPHSEAVRLVMEDGYSESDATTIVNAGSAERLQSYKDKVVSATQSLYEDNVIAETQALTIIEAMGYSEDEAKFIFQSSEFRRNARIISQAVSVIKSKYLSRHITETEAINYLNAVGVPTPQRDSLMKAWNIEHDAYTRVLTEAQVAKAVKLELLTADEGIKRLVTMGYSLADAELLIGGA